MPSSVALGSTLKAPTAAPVNTLAGTLADPETKPGRLGQAPGCRAVAGSGARVALTRVHSIGGWPVSGATCAATGTNWDHLF